MARNVPSGMSPGWFGTVVYRFVFGLNQIRGCLPLDVKRETTRLQLAGDVAVSESSKPPHPGGHDDSEIAPLAGCRQRRCSLAFAPSVNELPRDVASDVECLGYSAALCHKAG
jgi:hypothetical protein